MQFRLPDVGEGITESTLIKWHVAAGQQVEADQPFCQIETDKAVVDITSPCTGTVLSIDAEEGATIKVGTVIAQLQAEGEDVPTTRPAAAAPAIAPAAATPSSANGQAATEIRPGERAVPSTRRYARELGVDVSSITGTGPDGRILRDDVRSAAVTTRVPMSRLRRVIAENMKRSVSLIPHATSSFRCDAGAFVELRQLCEKRFGTRISYTAMLMKAMCPALGAHPYFNASLDEKAQEIILHRDFNVAFATHTEEGLMVPVVREVQRKSLAELSQEIDMLAERARERRLDLAELRGATITLSNLGSHGGHETTGRPIINHPQVALIAVGRIRPEPAVREGVVCVRPTLNITASYDHRLIDGVYASMFMEQLIEAIETPGVLEQ